MINIQGIVTNGDIIPTTTHALYKYSLFIVCHLFCTIISVYTITYRGGLFDLKK